MWALPEVLATRFLVGLFGNPVNASQVRISKLRRALAAIGVTGVVDREGGPIDFSSRRPVSTSTSFAT
jgi:hypothetical protein